MHQPFLDSTTNQLTFLNFPADGNTTELSKTMRDGKMKIDLRQAVSKPAVSSYQQTFQNPSSETKNFRELDHKKATKMNELVKSYSHLLLEQQPKFIDATETLN